jgi:hypothetical protein
MENVIANILSKLESLYNDFNKEYNNAVNGIYLLRNSQTGEYINHSYKSFVKVPVMEWSVTFNTICSKTINTIYDTLSSLAEEFKFRIYIYPAIISENDYSRAHILNRIKDDGFCICNRFNDTIGQIITIRCCLNDANNPLELLPYLVKDFQNYSWYNKKICIEEEPIKSSDIERKYYALYAALADKLANDNFVQVPKWVKDPYFTNPIPYNYGYGVIDDVPREFKAHNIIADVNEFINV